MKQQKITRQQHDSAKEKTAAYNLIVDLLAKFEGELSDEDFTSFVSDEWAPRARLLIEQWGTYKPAEPLRQLRRSR